MFVTSVLIFQNYPFAGVHPRSSWSTWRAGHQSFCSLTISVFTATQISSTLASERHGIGTDHTQTILGRTSVFLGELASLPLAFYGEVLGGPPKNSASLRRVSYDRVLQRHNSHGRMHFIAMSFRAVHLTE